MSQEFIIEKIFSFKGEYPIEWEEVPERIRLSDGSTRTDKSTFTEDEIKDAGYSIISIPNYNDETQYKTWTGIQFELHDYEFPETTETDDNFKFNNDTQSWEIES